MVLKGIYLLADTELWGKRKRKKPPLEKESACGAAIMSSSQAISFLLYFFPFYISIKKVMTSTASFLLQLPSWLYPTILAKIRLPLAHDSAAVSGLVACFSRKRLFTGLVLYSVISYFSLLIEKNTTITVLTINLSPSKIYNVRNDEDQRKSKK